MDDELLLFIEIKTLIASNLRLHSNELTRPRVWSGLRHVWDLKRLNPIGISLLNRQVCGLSYNLLGINSIFYYSSWYLFSPRMNIVSAKNEYYTSVIGLGCTTVGTRVRIGISADKTWNVEAEPPPERRGCTSGEYPLYLNPGPVLVAS